MTLIQLEYIIAVDNYRHFGKAAEACFVTQPTLSMQLHKLEEQLGVLIFDRSKSPVVPTDIGRRIIEQGRTILSESKKIQHLVDEEKGDMAGELRIGMIPTLSPYLLPLFINNFIQKYPKIKIKVEELVTSQLIEKIKNEQLDIGIIVTPFEDQNLLTKPIFYEEFYAYVSHRSKFFKEEKLSINSIPANEIWLLNEGHCFRDQVLNLCHTYKDRDAQFKYESGSLEALKKIVDKHGGMTLLPELATLDYDKTSQAKLREFDDPKPVREVSLAMHRGFLKRRIAEALHKEILDSIPDYINVQKHGKVIKWK